MNRISFDEVTVGNTCVKQANDKNFMNFSKEYLIAHKIKELLDPELNKRRCFLVFCDLYCIISENNISGIDAYLCLEELLQRRNVFIGNEIISLVDNMFFKFSWHEVDSLLKSCRVSRYDGWKMISTVVYCIQPIFFHYVNEKEFMDKWDSKTMQWTKIF